MDRAVKTGLFSVLFVLATVLLVAIAFRTVFGSAVTTIGGGLLVIGVFVSVLAFGTALRYGYTGA